MCSPACRTSARRSSLPEDAPEFDGALRQPDASLKAPENARARPSPEMART